MKLENSLLEQVENLLETNQENISKTEVETVSVSCSGCGWGCSGIVGD